MSGFDSAAWQESEENEMNLVLAHTVPMKKDKM